MSECRWHPRPDEPPIDGPCPDCEAAADAWAEGQHDRERER